MTTFLTMPCATGNPIVGRQEVKFNPLRNDSSLVKPELAANNHRMNVTLKENISISLSIALITLPISMSTARYKPYNSIKQITGLTFSAS